MARKNKGLPNAFEQFEEEDEVQVPEQVEVAVEDPQEEAQEHPQEALQEATGEVAEEVADGDILTVKEVTERLRSKYQEKAQKPTVEDTHTRTTFLFRDDLKKRLDRLAKNKRGFKTMFINEAVEALLDEYENN